jgi:hypothetical protein
MTEKEAIERAIAAVCEPDFQVGSRPIRGQWYESVSRRDPRPGWVVMIPLGLPDGISPNEVCVEVYEPDGEIYVRKIL